MKTGAVIGSSQKTLDFNLNSLMGKEEIQVKNKESELTEISIKNLSRFLDMLGITPIKKYDIISTKEKLAINFYNSLKKYGLYKGEYIRWILSQAMTEVGNMKEIEEEKKTLEQQYSIDKNLLYGEADYNGGGFLQLTSEDAYQNFAIYLLHESFPETKKKNNYDNICKEIDKSKKSEQKQKEYEKIKKVVTYGASAISEYYPWESACWFFAVYKNIKAYIDGEKIFSGSESVYKTDTCIRYIIVAKVIDRYTIEKGEKYYYKETIEPNEVQKDSWKLVGDNKNKEYTEKEIEQSKKKGERIIKLTQQDYRITARINGEVLEPNGLLQRKLCKEFLDKYTIETEYNHIPIFCYIYNVSYDI